MTALGKHCTKEQAFVAVYTAPDNIELRQAAKAEEMARRGA